MEKKKIKIMYFVSGLISGGVEKMIVNWCWGLGNERYEFIIVYQHQPVPQCLKMLKEAGCRTVQITARSDNFIKNILDSFKILRLYQPDIVHCNMNLMNFCALIPAKMIGIKVRISHSHIADKRTSFLYQCVERICRFLNNKSATIKMACGEDASNYLYGGKITTISLKEATHMLKCNKNKKFWKNVAVIVRNAIDLKEFCYTEDNIRKKLNLNDRIVIGHVGRFTQQKNQKRLLEIFAEYHKLHADSVLVIAGTGELKDELGLHVKKLGIDDSVYFLGVLSNMTEFYSAIDLLLLPSLYEGFPVVALETQAAGKPALFSDQIDSTTQVTDLIHFFSLKKSDGKWVEKIDQILKSEYIGDYKREMTEGGYNIDEEIHELDYLYQAAMGEFK